MKSPRRTLIQALCLLGLVQPVLAQQPEPQPASEPPPLGLKFSDPEFLKRSEQIFAEGYGAAPTVEEVPDFTLRDRLPPPGDQGNFNSCVAWATGYAFMTHLLWEGFFSPPDTEPPDHSQLLSPCFLYNRCATQNLVEKVGEKLIPQRSPRLTRPQGPELWYQEAFVCIGQYGICFHQQMPTPLGVPTRLATTTASQYESVLSMTSIPRDDNMLDAIKICLEKQGRPVLVGMEIDQRFYRNITAPFDEEGTDQNKKTRKIWKTFRGKSRGGHAMVITGWDEKLHCYEVLNSWGTWGGNGGYLWVDYQLMKEQARELWQLQRLEYKGGNRKQLASYVAPAPPPEIDFYCNLVERDNQSDLLQKNFFNVTPEDLRDKKIVPGTILQLMDGSQVFRRPQPPHKLAEIVVWPDNKTDPVLRGPAKVKVVDLLSFQVNKDEGTATSFWIGCKQIEP